MLCAAVSSVIRITSHSINEIFCLENFSINLQRRGKTVAQSVEILKFEIDHGLGARARLGLIVLQTDQTIEHDFSSIFCDKNDVSLYVARIPNAMEVSSKTLRQMAIDLPRTTTIVW